MHQSTKRQASFSRLATGHVSTRRSDILLAATDTFCGQERPDQLQIKQYRELFYSLISETDEISKRLIANSLAKHDFTPRPILLYFALETAAIAASVLAYAKGLGQFDLTQIIEKTSALHHRVIANRGDIGKTVVRRLMETGDKLTIRRLEQNKSIVSLMDRLRSSTSETTPEQVEPTGLSVAVDSDIQVGKKINSEYPAEFQAEKLPAPQSTNHTATPNPAAQTKVKLALDELVALANRGKKLGSIDDLLQETPGFQTPRFGDIVLEATRRKSRQEQVNAIQQEFGLSKSTANKVFEDHSGDTLAVLLKAGDVDNQIALQIITQSLPNVGLSEYNTTRVTKIYPALEKGGCRSAVLSWRRTEIPLMPEYQHASSDTQHSFRRPAESQPTEKKRKVFGNGQKLFGT